MENKLSKSQIKEFSSLQTAKGREKLGMFMAQGIKCVHDTIDHFETEALILRRSMCEDLVVSKILRKADPSKIFLAAGDEMQKVSTLVTTPAIIAIYRIPATECEGPRADQLSLALDCVQDPGNLGTIVRVADWMGVTDIFASMDTVDVWSPKVVLSSMGAISRVRVHYVDLYELLSVNSATMPIYGTFLNGENIYKTNLSHNGIIVMGNEGNGISNKIAETITHRITIPSYPKDSATSESLNVAIATAITLSEFRRNG